VIGNETTGKFIIVVNGQFISFLFLTCEEMENLNFPSQNFKGFIEMSAMDFQQNIHELFQTSTVVSFATDFNDFRMITDGSTGGGFSPRHLVFEPSSDGGIKFVTDGRNPFEQRVEKKDTLSFTDGDDSCPFDPISTKNEDDSEAG
jgi:hypothetical protein